ncbi:hypothetical protein KFL_001120100 [Klebsormidium nitens]|uniref:Uncharacterized protein n=1 Tax=Klebsormidium nitens TaxID=105231 RepID=A0A1Y1I115_KLENI|nr:hypothetical protein KFL_001120100 [Klebsormidium nitens]|eukprot:GAQ82466.1 hypothetical protein KFL_001120100 [Klebsormidium nitens]
MEKLSHLGLSFMFRGGSLVLWDKDDDKEASQVSPKPKKSRQQVDDERSANPGATTSAESPKAEVPAAQAGHVSTSVKDLSALFAKTTTSQEQGVGTPAASAAAQATLQSAANDDGPPLRLTTPADDSPSAKDDVAQVHPEELVDEEAKATGGKDTAHPAGADASSGVKEVAGNKRPNTGRLEDVNKTPVDTVRSGRASPPQGVEPDGVVLSDPTDTKEKGVLETPGDATEREAPAADVSGGAQPHGASEPRVTTGVTGIAAPPQGVEPAGAFLSAGDVTAEGPPTAAGEEAEDAADGNVGHGTRGDVSRTAQAVNENEETKEDEGVLSDKVQGVGSYEDRTPPGQDVDVTPPPEPVHEGEPDARMAAARDRLDLANEILTMETVDLLDALLELSGGVLKGEAPALSVLEAKRQAGTLPSDGGGVLERIVSAYKTKTGNPAGKQVFKNIRDWEAARDAVLEADFALLQTEEKPAEPKDGERREGRGTVEGGGMERQITAGQGGQIAAVEEDVHTGEKSTGNGLTGGGADDEQGDENKENETGFEPESDSAEANRRGILTENGQDEGEGVGQDGERNARRTGTKSGGGQRRTVELNEIDGAKGVSEESDAGAERDESSVEAAAVGGRVSMIPQAPHLRSQTPASCDYVTVRGRGSGVGDAASQRLTRSRSVSPGRPPRYGERRRTQSASGIATPANPGYVSSAGLLHESNATVQATATPSTFCTPTSDEQAPLKNWVEKPAGCAFVVGGGGLALATGGQSTATAAANANGTGTISTAEKSATKKGSKAFTECEVRAVVTTSLASAGPVVAAAGGQSERVRTTARQETAAAEQEAAAREQAAAAKEQQAVAAGADPSPGVWAEVLASLLGEEDTDPKSRLDGASKPVGVHNADVVEDESVAAAVGLLRLASAVPEEEDFETILEPGDDAGSWLCDGKEAADAEGAAENGELVESQIAGVAERWLQE